MSMTWQMLSQVFIFAECLSMTSPDKHLQCYREGVSLPLRAVDVVRGAPDGDGFRYPSHPPIR